MPRSEKAVLDEKLIASLLDPEPRVFWYIADPDAAGKDPNARKADELYFSFDISPLSITEIQKRYLTSCDPVKLPPQYRKIAQKYMREFGIELKKWLNVTLKKRTKVLEQDTYDKNIIIIRACKNGIQETGSLHTRTREYSAMMAMTRNIYFELPTGYKGSVIKDIWFDIRLMPLSLFNSSFGKYVFSHEVGHACALDHPRYSIPGRKQIKTMGFVYPKEITLNETTMYSAGASVFRCLKDHYKHSKLELLEELFSILPPKNPRECQQFYKKKDEIVSVRDFFTPEDIIAIQEQGKKTINRTYVSKYYREDDNQLMDQYILPAIIAAVTILLFLCRYR